MIRALRIRVAALFRRRHPDAALDAEIRAHLALVATDYERRGMTPEAARHAPRRAFGGVESMKERYRDRAVWPAVTTVMQDARHAWRSLARSPCFTVPVVLSLAFAIGANVAAFSLVNTLVLRPLPVEDPDRLFHVRTVDETRTSDGGNYGWFERIRERARGVSSVFIAHRRSAMKVAVAVQLSGLVSGVVFGLSPGDPRLYATAAVVLSSTAIVAAARPVVRALHIHPADALRSE